MCPPCLRVCWVYYYVLLWRFGVFFSPKPAQMNLERSSSTSPITITATSPSRPSIQLTFLALAEGKTRKTTHKTAGERHKVSLSVSGLRDLFSIWNLRPDCLNTIFQNTTILSITRCCVVYAKIKLAPVSDKFWFTEQQLVGPKPQDYMHETGPSYKWHQQRWQGKPWPRFT